MFVCFVWILSCCDVYVFFVFVAVCGVVRGWDLMGFCFKVAWN